jgi:hypothetical protein
MWQQIERPLRTVQPVAYLGQRAYPAIARPLEAPNNNRELLKVRQSALQQRIGEGVAGHKPHAHLFTIRHSRWQSEVANALTWRQQGLAIGVDQKEGWIVTCWAGIGAIILPNAPA